MTVSNVTQSPKGHADVECRVPECANKANNDDCSGSCASVDSADEALMEMLGITSLGGIMDEDDEDDGCKDENSSTIQNCTNSPLPILSEEHLLTLVAEQHLHHLYTKEAVCLFPPQCSVSPEYMRRLTDELVWGGTKVQADKTYETIQVWRDGEIYPKKSLTRLEHFVDSHPGWSDLCHNYLQRLVSKVVGVEMVLYKEKLNLKPPGGSGFAPHLDTPSLRIALGDNGPQTFCTVMVAIDDMTLSNGCLRICKGEWNEDSCVTTVAPEIDGNPDAGGRAGAIPLEVADTLEYEPLVCKSGTIAVFNGWAPHRSAANTSPFPRRAVFLTYNPASEGDFHQRYYQMMDEKRQRWRESVGLLGRQDRYEDEQLELQALSTIPKI